MNNFYSNLSQSINQLFNDPTFQSRLMTARGVPFAEQDARLARLERENQKKQATAAQEYAKQTLSRLGEGGFSEEDILELATIDPGLAEKIAGIQATLRPKQRERDIKIQELVQRGLSIEDAQDVVSGRIKVTQDARGNPIMVNTATGAIVNPGTSAAGGGAADFPAGDMQYEPPAQTPPAQASGQKTYSQLTPDEIASLPPSVVKDLKEQEQQKSGFKATYENFAKQYELQKQKIASAREKIGSGVSTGIINQITGFVDASPSGSLNSDLNTIKGNVFIDAIAELKRASPTGASGLGPITEKEGERILSSRGDLRGELRAEDLLRNLENYERNLDQSFRSISAEASKYLPQSTKKEGARRLRYNPATGRLE